MTVSYKFDYSELKDAKVREQRGVGFRDIIDAFNKGNVLDDIDHFNRSKYPNQRIMIVKIREKVYAVPYVKDSVREVIFLKTIYPSRKLKARYLK